MFPDSGHLKPECDVISDLQVLKTRIVFGGAVFLIAGFLAGVFLMVGFDSFVFGFLVVTKIAPFFFRY